MTAASTPRIIALEEHFMHAALTDHFSAAAAHQPQKLKDRLYDFVGVRLEEMDQAGIDMQILSHQSPGSQRLADDVAIAACQGVNDALAQVIAENTARFDGFAMLPTNLPGAAADELRRSVEELGLKGAMVHGLSASKMIDAPEFWPIFAQAEALDVPIYLHPALPDKIVTERYYAPYDQSHPMFTRAAWGFGVEAGTQAIRLILSGIFERHPNLKILLGHFGEALPFWMTRIHASLARPGGDAVDFEGIFKRNFWITTSGFFCDNALETSLRAVSSDRILFAVDWPYADNAQGVNWLKDAPINDTLRNDIFSGNAQKLLRL